jgi:hypothetical protein
MHRRMSAPRAGRVHYVSVDDHYVIVPVTTLLPRGLNTKRSSSKGDGYPERMICALSAQSEMPPIGTPMGSDGGCWTLVISDYTV